MKRFLSIVLLLSLAVCMVACGEKDLPKEEEINLLDKVESGDKNEQIQKYFPESDIDKFAKTQVIRLPENPTTGYEWVFFVDDSEVMTVIKDEFEAPTETNGLVGVGGYRVCEIQGLEEGETIIDFDYIRGFESGEVPAESVRFYISVNANNEIAVTDEIH